MPTFVSPSPWVTLDPEACYAAMRSRDARFDGCFVSAVVSTGIYCRPSCPALTPMRRNVCFHRTAAAAQAAGFRACKRCRPDACPGSPTWDTRADVVGRAVRLVEDGYVDREGVEGLAARLGYSARQLRRHLHAEVGAGPLALARAQRARTARVLLESTNLSIADIAFAAGFGSIRQCNDTVRAVYAVTPTSLRTAAGRILAAPGAITLRLPYRLPGAVVSTLAFLGAHAVPGVESFDGTTYARSMALPRGPGLVLLRCGGSAGPRHVEATLRLHDLRDLPTAVARCRRLLDLDADPQAVDAALSTSPFLAPLVRAFPGRRVAGSVDGPETVLRTLLGQQVSLAAARTLAGRLTARFGEPLAHPYAGVTHLFPSPPALADVDPTTLPMPAPRARALVALARALADGLVIDVGADRAEAEAALLAVPGIGPWSARYIRMRALADPDVLLVEDLAVRRVASALGLPGDPVALEQVGRPWAPWRSYATGLLWARALTDRRSV